MSRRIRPSAETGEAWRGFVRLLQRAYIFSATIALLVLTGTVVSILLGAINVIYVAPTAETLVHAARATIGWLFSHAPEIVRSISFLLFATALFLAAMKIDQVFRIVSEFNKARNPISDLRTSVTEMNDVVGALRPQLGEFKQSAEALGRLAPVMQDANESLTSIRDQIFRLQEEAVSQRADQEAQSAPEASGTDANSIRPTPVPDPGVVAAEDAEQTNWDDLRTIWKRNNRRINDIIKYRLPRAKARKYDNMSRTDYPAIMERLAGESMLTRAAFDGSMQLHKLFMGYRSRRRKVTEEAIGSARLLNDQLERLIGPFAQESDDGGPGAPVSPLETSVESADRATLSLTEAGRAHGEQDRRARVEN